MNRSVRECVSRLDLNCQGRERDQQVGGHFHIWTFRERKRFELESRPGQREAGRTRCCPTTRKIVEKSRANALATHVPPSLPLLQDFQCKKSLPLFMLCRNEKFEVGTASDKSPNSAETDTIRKEEL